ncbi:hypothetical protein [Kamptonema formosum]|nr:hypothetical protein [Oscillatoria sp. PCC 10802]
MSDAGAVKKAGFPDIQQQQNWLGGRCRLNGPSPEDAGRTIL